MGISDLDKSNMCLYVSLVNDNNAKEMIKSYFKRRKKKTNDNWLGLAVDCVKMFGNNRRCSTNASVNSSSGKTFS